MFSGIVSGIGELLDVEEKSDGLRRLVVACDDDPNYQWSMDCESSSVTNLWNVTVRVTRSRSDGSQVQCVLSQMVLDPAQRGSAFVRTRRKDLDWVFSIQHQRTVNQDNTVALDNRILQIEKSRWRNTLAGCTVTVHEFLDGSMAIRFGPHQVARFDPQALPSPLPKKRKSPRPLGHGRSAA